MAKRQKAATKPTRYAVIHENADGEELERSEPFTEESDAANHALRLLRSINFFAGDALRCVDHPED